jgi:two-component system, cell cycle sensor histidine kinase and response regulator CckA
MQPVDSFVGHPLGHAVIVNDEPTQLRLLTHIVELAGLLPRPYSSVEEALRPYTLAASGIGIPPTPELIITDISMPSIDGWQFCRLLRSEEYRCLNAVPIIVVSATYAGMETERIARALGVDVLLSPSVGHAALLDAIRRACKKKDADKSEKALIFEFEQGIRDGCREALEEEGYEVDTPSTIEATLALLAQKEYGLLAVCVDGLGGEFHRLYSSLSRQPKSLCLFTSVAPTPARVIEWLSHGVAAYLKRPLSPHRLRETARMLLRERSLQHMDALVDRQVRDLLESRERFQIVADFTADWEIWISPQKEIVYTNPSCEKITGYSADEFIADSRLLSEMVIAEDLPLYRQHEEQLCSQNHLGIEFRIRRKDGEIRWIEHTCRPVYGVNGVWRGRRISNRDITARKEGEEALRRNRQELQAIYDHVPVMLAVVDGNGTVVFKNRAFIDFTDALEKGGAGERRSCQLFGCLTDHDGSGLCPHRRQCRTCPARSAVENTLVHGTAAHDIEFTLAGSEEGVTDAFVLSLSTSLLENGTERRALLCLRDITERKRAEEAVGLRERYFRSLFENAGDAIFIEDENDRIVDVNEKACDLLGYSREELLRLSVPDLQAPSCRQPLGSVVRSELEKHDGKPFETVDQRKDGTLVPVEVTTVVLGDGSTRRVLSIVRDITARKRAEEERERLHNQYHQSQKIESIGRMAGGMAHDFNNMLSVILGQVEIAQTKIDKPHPLQEYLRDIHKATLRSIDLTRQILMFARKQEVTRKHLDLNRAVHSIIKMLRRLLGENIEIAFSPGRDLGTIFIDSTQVDQILTNLCINARDAISGKGAITIETSTVNLDMAYCQARPDVMPGKYVLLAVHDSGCGIPVEYRSRLFEPFFTTKATGAGTGLGLFTVYGIVKQNQGHIEFSTVIGQGTSFFVFLPRHPTQIGDDEGQAEHCALPGTETILVVEDEGMILKMINTMLTTLGYTVLLASTPMEAVSVVKEKGGRIDMVITDVVMPGMSGFELIRSLQSLRPEIRYLYMSGYPEGGAESSGRPLSADVFLSKPFTVSVLASKVRSILDGMSQDG